MVPETILLFSPNPKYSNYGSFDTKLVFFFLLNFVFCCHTYVLSFFRGLIFFNRFVPSEFCTFYTFYLFSHPAKKGQNYRFNPVPGKGVEENRNKSAIRR